MSRHREVPKKPLTTRPPAFRSLSLPSNLEPRTSNICLFIRFRTLLRSPNSQLFSFQSFPHSFPKTPGGGGHSLKFLLNCLPVSSLECAVEHPMKDASPACPVPDGEGASRPKDLNVHVSLLECAVTQNATLSALECAVTKTRPHKCFRMRSSEKKVGGGATLFASRVVSTSYEMLRLQALCFDIVASLPGGGYPIHPLQSKSNT